MKYWSDLKQPRKTTLKKKNFKRRITTDLEWKARQKPNLTDKNIDFLESLLKVQEHYPQLTKKQWYAFNKTFIWNI